MPTPRPNVREQRLDNLYDMKDRLRGKMPREEREAGMIARVRLVILVALILFWVGSVWMIVHYAESIDGFLP